MEQDQDQVVQAINIASDPTQAALHQEALNYLATIQQNAENTWRLALPLFVDATPDGARKYPPQVRFFALRVLDEFFDNRFEPLDDDSFRTIQQSLVTYIQTEYVYGPAEANSPFLRNKFSHTLTLFFLCTYMTQWPTFFSDLFTLIRPAQSSSSSQPAFNRHIILLFFHIVLEISGEVADQMLKAARPYDQARHTRDARVRDAVRERDAASINEAVLTIVSDGAETMKKGDGSRESQAAIEVVDLGIRTFGSYVGWIDINLTITPTTVPLLFSLLADPSLSIRLATTTALSRILAKGLKEPGDKLQLLKVLSLGQVIDALEGKTRTEQAERTETDDGEESYREALGKLLNVLGLEISKLLEDPTTSEAVAAEGHVLLAQTLPILLRFMADEYDDTCSTVFPFLQTILASYRRSRKKPTDPLDDNKRAFLTSLLQVILVKMKWEEDTDVEDPDEDDIAEFETMRKELRVLMDAVTLVDLDLVTDAMRTLTLNTIGAFQSGMPVKWNDAELAAHLVYMFGEINKGANVKGRIAFCQAPPLDKDKPKKLIDYSAFPLTPHGELLFALVQSNISSYPHRSVALQFFEAAARYPDFFKVRKNCIMPTLEAMVDARGLHNPDASHRSRVSYLFHRFIKEIRNDVPEDVVANIADSLRDLLPIEVQLPDGEESESQDLLSELVKNSAFDSQLYLYETVGALTSLLYKTPDRLAPMLLSFVKPLMSELSDNLQAYRTKGSQDLIPIVKVHHVIMALGNIARGFPEYPSPVPAGYIPLPVDAFGEVAQAILVCLESMNTFRDIRDASRFAFARVMATTGPSVTHFIPQLMASLLTQFEPSELVDFLNFIGLLIHKLQADLFPVLDELIGPLSAHITRLLTQPISGTDDQRAHAETKKAYLALLNNILASKLQGVFISEKNRGGFDSLMETMISLTGDISDPASARAALVFLGRSITLWGQPVSSASNGNGHVAEHSLPGFDRYVYERIVTSVFAIPSLPDFNLKDPGLTPVLHEIANLLQTVFKTRGTEAHEYFLGVFLPSQGWPANAALDFVSKLRDLDGKAFRKYFTEFVRTSRSEPS